jgi:DNA-binding CsgD family transcriptional regulator
MTSIRLPDRDLRLLLDAAGRCTDATGCHLADVEDVLDAVAGLVGCDVAFWNWFHVRPVLREEALVGAPRGREPTRAPVGPWFDHLAEHPIMSGRHGPVTMISDVLVGRELEATWLFQEALAPDGLVSEIGVELSHGGDDMSVVVLSRGPGTPFAERDRLVLRLLRPHIDSAIRRYTRPEPAVSPRQLEVLALVREGLTNAQAARRLGIAEATVAKHLEHVFAKTGARSRAQAVAMCAELLDDVALDSP